MKKVLISGFEPFDENRVNPSEILLEYIQKKIRKDELGFQAFTQLLPVVFADAFAQLKTKCEEVKPDLIVATGLAKNRSKISIEKVAINWIDARIKDNSGKQPMLTKINAELNDGYFSTVEIEKALQHFSHPQVEISYSAGSFVCNELYFKMLTELNIPAIFIHIPGKCSLGDDEIFDLICKFIELI